MSISIEKYQFTGIKFLHKNEPISSLTHLVGLFLAISGFTSLVIFAVLYGTLSHIIGYAIFGIGQILLFGASSIYHFFPSSTKLKNLLQRIDHAMIFVYMACSYTPLCLTVNNHVLGWGLLTIVWLITVVGVILKSVNIKMKDWISTMLYVGFGLLLLVPIYPISQWLSFDGMWWLYGGGSLYMIGVIFFVLDDYVKSPEWFGFHEIFHIFVLAGSFSHYWLFLKYVLYI